jgi:hypothetical protein
VEPGQVAVGVNQPRATWVCPCPCGPSRESGCDLDRPLHVVFPRSGTIAGLSQVVRASTLFCFVQSADLPPESIPGDGVRLAIRFLQWL